METTNVRVCLVKLLLAGSGLTLTGCETLAPTEQMPLQFSEASRPPGGFSFPNWPAAPDRLEIAIPDVLGSDRAKLVTGKRTARGTSGAKKVVLMRPADAYPDIPETIIAKWKQVPENDIDHFNNSPRRELSAYQIQKLFLDPEDYVVPLSLLHCVPLANYVADGHPQVRPTIEGTNCVFGNLTVWLLDVTIPDEFYDSAHFVRDPAYAYFMSNLNAFTYMIAHRDARQGNFVVSKDPNRRQVFSIDNGESFGSLSLQLFRRELERHSSVNPA